MYFFVILLYLFNKILINCENLIPPEISTELRLKICSHERNPLHHDVMLYFPDIVRFCGSLHTNKNKRLLDREKQKTTFIEPKVVIKFQAINSTNQCSITFTGYQNEYRFSPDLGYYSTCQKSISQYISSLVDNETPVWTPTNHLCPIQGLPHKTEDYMACDLLTNTWYQLSFFSSIRYETYKNRLYHKHYTNYTTNYIFKPDFIVHRKGDEKEWLKTLVDFKVIQDKCEIVRYLVKIDKDWPILIKTIFEYQIKHNEKIKHFQRIDNGTIRHWHSGEFRMIRDYWKQDLCVQIYWKGSKTKYRLCETFSNYNECPKIIITSKSDKKWMYNFNYVIFMSLIYVSYHMLFML
uniref:SUN domain-containing protein n=1 Tax=Parastrongyloides trichosuri TaxID=131310 RepID=A0A0N5A1U8_PARTI